jgi:transposase
VRRSLDPLEDLVGLDRKLKDLDKRLKTAVAATATTLTDIKGVGTATAAMILGEVGDVRRFPTRHHFATYTGVAPIEVSSGEVQRHRLSRAGNRQLNHALHIIALTNKRYDPRGGDYYAKKVAAGKGKKGALRCLKRRLSDNVYRRLVDDQQLRAQGSPGGHLGATLQSNAAGSHPNAGTSEQPHTGLHEDPTPGYSAAS